MTSFWPNAHAFVTGAGSGIGAATAIALAKAGVRVSIAGRRIDALKATAAMLGKCAGAIVAIDVTDEAAVRKGVAQIEAEAGPIDILVNNAGKAGSAPFDKTDAVLWADMLASNLTSVFLVTHAVLPGMAKRGRGRVINVASTAGLTGYGYVSAYVAAKHGVVGLT
ncbi:SDR family NAD(P)-dependent oxidoreductase, partial [Bradyrhizobium sp. WSM 1704]|uniref:SDR family oxidoreductase n=1 Tax=Bradyrhizobium semiaridum TaxID=2821404 RepID=UPI001CE2B73A